METIKLTFVNSLHFVLKMFSLLKQITYLCVVIKNKIITIKKITTMKTFNELFQQANEISDKRKKIFNELIKKTETEIIPAFAELLTNYDIKKAFFTMHYHAPFKTDRYEIDGQRDEEGDLFYAYAIEDDGSLWECSKNIYTDQYECIKNYKLEGTDLIIENTAKLKRSTVLKFLVKIQERIQELNQKYSSINEKAESLLHK